MSIEEHNIVEETIQEAAVRIIQDTAPDVSEEVASRIAEELFENMLLADVRELNDYLIQVSQWQQRAKEGWVEEWGTKQQDEPDFLPPVVWDSFEEARAAASEDESGATDVLVRKVKPWDVVSYSNGSDI